MNYSSLKRIIDLLIAFTLLLIFLPIWIIIPIAIYLTSPGPILYKHHRMGKGGTEFDMYKFRSMVVNADEILHKLDKDLLRKFKEGDWKLEAKDDPRITKLGRALRALTIDEFPQLLNVIRGEMSMVGPRAYLKKELNEQMKKYPASRKGAKILKTIKPGITGLWQVSGRNEVTFDKRIELDAEYARRISLWTDISIMIRTPRAMISKW